MKLNSKKIKFTMIMATLLMVVALLIFFVVASLTSIGSDDSSSLHGVQFFTDIVAHDPTKLDVPDWAIMLMEVSMYVVIGLLSTAIIGYLIYIAVYFIKRRTGTLSAEVSEQVEEHDENPNLVKLSLGGEVANEKSN